MEYIEFHNDGHRISLRVEQGRVIVRPEPCPHKGDREAACYSSEIPGCAVNHMISAYGLELNLGACPAESTLEIAWYCREWKPWSMLDSEFRYMPIADTDFHDWFQRQDA